LHTGFPLGLNGAFGLHNVSLSLCDEHLAETRLPDSTW
jgi:hypothetical protein